MQVNKIKLVIEAKLARVNLYATISANSKKKEHLNTLAIQSGVRAGLLTLAYDLGIEIDCPKPDLLKNYQAGKELVIASTVVQL